MFELAVEPEDPFRVYSAGETVKGHLVLTVTKGFDITHLVVTLHGYAKVFKHQVTNGEGFSNSDFVVNGKGSRGFEYYGSGLASLFQEEQILCGSGFLKKQVYKFAFELPFPAKSMPSTLSFERGAVSYMLSATLTRPVTMIPTHTVFKAVKFKDSLDVESMNTPKSRIVSMEPVKRGRVKKVKATTSVGTGDTSSRGKLTRQDTQGSSTSNQAARTEPPLSPAPSEDTVATTATTSSTSFRQVELDSQNRKRSDDTKSTNTSSSGSAVTAVAELQKHGALPGDTIPIRVFITHTKPYVKGLVIATLYRIGRVDMHPAIPLANLGKHKKAEYEDVYPKSKTGLGGLYFASSSPSSAFRKDLSQTSTIMVIDPGTLTSDIRTSIRVPEEAFPTISNVPGGMISFTYHIEVVVDLFGKLGETRLLPRLTSGEPTFTTSMANSSQLTHEWSNSILDTTSLRRNKSVATFEFNLIVGTKDSSRNKRPQQPPAETQHQSDPSAEEHYDEEYHEGEGEYWYYDENGQVQYYDPYYYEGYEGQDGYGYDQQHYHQPPPHEHQPPPAIEIPPPQAEEEVDEKTRLRRQEALLMPTQPPDEAGPSSGSAQHAPSAPVLDGDGIEPPEGLANPPTPGPPASVASARSVDTVRPYDGSPPPPPPPPAGSSTDDAPTEDKQELERRRIMAQASVPPVVDSAGEGSSQQPVMTPSAPMLSEDDIHVDGHGHEHELPQYQR
jgi:arrestin-related trafficking adapter 9